MGSAERAIQACTACLAHYSISCVKLFAATQNNSFYTTAYLSKDTSMLTSMRTATTKTTIETVANAPDHIVEEVSLGIVRP